jgi:enoyl-CoA hydratase
VTGQAVQLERKGRIGWITLNRPASINAINHEIRVGLPAALRQADADSDIAVIAIRGAGDRGFCAGADLKEARQSKSILDTRKDVHSLAWIDAFDEVRKPLLAAIQGYCMGGGLEIAMACDIRIASPEAIFALPEVGLGLIPAASGTQRLPRLIGLSRALDMMLLCERVDARQALDCGLITRLATSRETLEADAAILAERLADKPAQALAFAKEAARQAPDIDLAAGLRIERDLFAMLRSAAHSEQTVTEVRSKSAAQG